MVKQALMPAMSTEFLLACLKYYQYHELPINCLSAGGPRWPFNKSSRPLGDHLLNITYSIHNMAANINNVANINSLLREVLYNILERVPRETVRQAIYTVGELRNAAIHRITTLENLYPICR